MDVPSSALRAFAEPEVDAELAVADVARGLASFVAEVVDGSGVSVVMGDQEGAWHVISASSDTARERTVADLVQGSGPCFDVLRNRTPLHLADHGSSPRPPALARVTAGEAGSSTLVLPLSTGRSVLGALCLFGGSVTSFTRRRRHVEALAELAALALSQGAAAIRAQRSAHELEHALATRITIEQAKGMLAEQSGIDLPAAFSCLLRQARARGVALEDLARDVVDGRVAAEELDELRRAAGQGHRPPPEHGGSRSGARASSPVPP